jgi:hypothetical protein
MALDQKSFEFCRRFQGVLSVLAPGGRIPQNVWQSSAQSSAPKNGCVSRACRGALIGRLTAVPEKE